MPICTNSLSQYSELTWFSVVSLTGNKGTSEMHGTSAAEYLRMLVLYTPIFFIVHEECLHKTLGVFVRSWLID